MAGNLHCVRAPTQDRTAGTASSTTTSARVTLTAMVHGAASWQAVGRSATCLAVAVVQKPQGMCSVPVNIRFLSFLF